MSITEDKSSVSKMPRNTNRGGRLIEYAQLHGIAGHWTPASRSGIAVVPISPRGGIVRQALTGDVAQCLINPFARLWIERRVFRKLQQPGSFPNCGLRYPPRLPPPELGDRPS